MARHIGWVANCFARECSLDELAQVTNASPVDFGQQLLADSSGGRAVLDAVVAMSNFGNAPEGRAHGLSRLLSEPASRRSRATGPPASSVSNVSGRRSIPA